MQADVVLTPPTRVNRIPMELVKLICRSNNTTARAIVKTCLQLHPVSWARRTLESSSLGRDRHGQSSSLLVGGERDNVQATSNDPIHHQCDRLGPGHLRRTILPDALQFTSVPPVDDALNEGEGRHAHEQVKGVLRRGQLKTPRDGGKVDRWRRCSCSRRVKRRYPPA